MRVAIVGGGSWGTAFATVARAAGNEVCLALRDPVQAARVRATRVNDRYLPGVAVDDAVEVAVLDEWDASRVEAVVLAIPSRAFTAVCRMVGPRLPADAVVLSLTKGLEPETGERLSVVAARELAIEPGRVAVLSGPNHAEEIARQAPAAAVLASSDIGLARQLQRALAVPTFRLYSSPDVVGVELAGASKNVIAIAAGVSDGLGLGDNAKASLITRGLAEMQRLGAAFDADRRTFAGLAGLGDLVATCCSLHSRNRRAGELLAAGVRAVDLERQIGMVAEGLTTAPTLLGIARSRSLDLPITERVCAVLEGERPRQAVELLLSRAPADE